MNTQDRQRFEKDGYVHLPVVLTKADLEPVEQEYRLLLAERIAAWVQEGRLAYPPAVDPAAPATTVLVALGQVDAFDACLLDELDITPPYTPFSVPRCDDRFHLGPAVLYLLANPRLTDVLAQILGSELLASPNQHSRFKLPARTINARQGRGALAPTLWHQDQVTQMPVSDASDTLTCWIAITDASEENGCLVVAPGWHHDPDLLPWPLDAATIDRLEGDAVPVPARRGDVVLMHRRTPHCSLPNRSDHVRWSLDLRYYASDMPSDRPWFPSVKVRSAAPSSIDADVAIWRKRWNQAMAELVATRQPLPGRAEWARSFAESLIEGWTAGNHPTADLSGL